jgi:hypothetical protein
MRRELATIAVITVVIVTSGGTVHADGSIDAKLQCQVEYGSQSEMGAACKQGVDFAQRAAAKSEDAMSQCTASRENGARVTACQQGVALFARFGGQVRNTDKSAFSYSWSQPKTGFQVDVGEYQASVGNQKAVEDCMRNFDGGSFDGTGASPSCMSGITVQPQAPAPVGAPARK